MLLDAGGALDALAADSNALDALAADSNALVLWMLWMLILMLWLLWMLWVLWMLIDALDALDYSGCSGCSGLLWLWMLWMLWITLDALDADSDALDAAAARDAAGTRFTSDRPPHLFSRYYREQVYAAQYSAVLRLARIPVVRSVCSLLTVYYADTKGRHPSVRSACSLLESSVTSVSAVAYDRFAPVIHKMEPQIVVVNDLTCRGLDWLENRFPVLQKPTEQITAEARTKILEVKELVSIVGSGTVHLVQHTVTWAVGRLHLGLAGGGEGVAVVVCDRGAHLPLAMTRTRDSRAAERSGCVEGFEVDLVHADGAQLVASLVGLMLRRTYLVIQTTLHHLVFKSPYLVEQVLGAVQAWGLRDLPQQIQQQLMSAIFFVSQMYTLVYAVPQQFTPPPRQTSTPNGQPVNRYSPPDHSPVFPQSLSNGKPRRKLVKIPSANGCHVACGNGAAREITFKYLAYSDASSLFFWVRCLFRAMRRRLCCSTRGVTSRWILGALDLGFLPGQRRQPQVTGLRTTYCLTSSSLDRLNSLRILLALLGPRRRGTVLSVEDAEVGVHDAAAHRLALALAGAAGAVAGVALAEQQPHAAVGQHTLLHGEALLVVAAADAHHVALEEEEEPPGGVCGDLGRHPLLVESPQLALIVHFDQLLAASRGEGDVEL
ncbi:hypothetical protein CRUP_025717 [Coryphaenoides rupestris]|nr:hypothetical protein CRUP_025717 [Coryphaenoides rupestris]